MQDVAYTNLVMDGVIYFSIQVTSFETHFKCVTRYSKSKFSLCRVSTTSQQFLLKEYLASTPPDLLIVFGNAHDSMRFTLREHAMNVRTFLDMIDVYLPPTTRVIWTSKCGEYEPKKPLVYQGPIYENRTMHILQWLDAANKIQFKETRRHLLKNGRPLEFMDLLEMSEPVLSEWSLDGVHMDALWYQHVISYLMQSLCVEQ